MGIPTSRKVCPKCESTEVHRMRRSLWMRPLPKTYYYHCSYCKHRFISYRSDLMFLTGAFLFALGEGLIIFASSLDELGIGSPGFGFQISAEGWRSFRSSYSFSGICDNGFMLI